MSTARHFPSLPTPAALHRSTEEQRKRHPAPCAYGAQILQSLSQMNFVSFMTPVNIICSNLHFFKVTLLKKRKKKHRKK